MLIRGMDISSGIVIIAYICEDYDTEVLHDILLKCICDGNEFYMDVDLLMYGDENVTVYTSIESYVNDMLSDCKILSVREAN